MPDRPYQEVFYELKEAILRGKVPISMGDLEQGIQDIRIGMTGILAALERLKNERLESDFWDTWYNSIPHDIKERINLHDFKRLGECFKQAFKVED